MIPFRAGHARRVAGDRRWNSQRSIRPIQLSQRRTIAHRTKVNIEAACSALRQAIAEKEWTEQSLCAEEQTACKNTVAKIDVVAILPDVSVLDTGARPQIAKTNMQKLAAVSADQATILLTAKLVEFESGEIEQPAAAEAAFRRRIATDRRTVIDSPSNVFFPQDLVMPARNTA